MQLRTCGYEFELPTIKYEFNKRNFIVRSLLGQRFALCYGTFVCRDLSVLSVTLVYCGQTVGWIKMLLGREVGLGPCHIVLDGDPAPPPKGGGIPPIFGP